MKRCFRASAAAWAALAGTVLALPACTPPELLSLRSGLDSLRTVVDTLNVRDAVTFRMVQETRKEVAEQRDILLSTKATAGTTTQELFELMERLNGKLDDVMRRFQQVSDRAPPATTTPQSIDPNELYEQATQDLTQGRYALALQNYEEFVRRFPATELSDNAQYGIGEAYFAQSKFDSAATAYERVGSLYPQGERVPAALYKLALSHEKLGRASQSKETLQELVRRFPLSGEAQLARERLGTTKRR